MLETYLRPAYQCYLVEPIAKRVTRFSPKKVTYFACLSGLLMVPALMLGLLTIATLLLIVSGFLDTLDGTLARIKSKESDVGTVLDIISDRAVEFAAILGLYAVDPTHRGLLALAMLGSCYLCVTSFLVVGIFTPNRSEKGFHYSPGLIERAEAFIFFIMMIWLPDYFATLASLFTLLVLLTTYLHLKQFMQFKASSRS